MTISTLVSIAVILVAVNQLFTVSCQVCRETGLSLQANNVKVAQSICNLDQAEFFFTSESGITKSIEFSLTFQTLSSQLRKANTYVLFASTFQINQPADFIHTYLARNLTQIALLSQQTSSSIIQFDHNKFFTRRRTLRVVFPQTLQQNESAYFYLVTLDSSTGEVKDPLLYEAIMSFEYVLRTSSVVQTCNGHGESHKSANSIFEECVCDKGYFDEDCATSAVNIYNQTSSSLLQLRNTTLSTDSYLYINLTEMTSNYFTGYSLNFLANKKAVFSAQSFTEGELESSQLSERLLASMKQYMAVSMNQVQSEYYNDVITGLTKTNASSYRIYKIAISQGSIQLAIKLDISQANSSSDNSKMTYIIYLLVLAIAITIAIVKIVYQFIDGRRKYDQTEIRPNPSDINSQQANIDKNVNEKLLEDIVKYLPAQVYSAELRLKLKNIEICCAVCLEEYKFVEDSVRVTPCSHIFHAKCLEEWVQAQQNCPLCRFPLTSESIMKFGENEEKQRKREIGIQVAQILDESCQLTDQKNVMISTTNPVLLTSPRSDLITGTSTADQQQDVIENLLLSTRSYRNNFKLSQLLQFSSASLPHPDALSSIQQFTESTNKIYNSPHLSNVSSSEFRLRLASNRGVSSSANCLPESIVMKSIFSKL